MTEKLSSVLAPAKRVGNALMGRFNGETLGGRGGAGGAGGAGGGGDLGCRRGLCEDGLVRVGLGMISVCHDWIEDIEVIVGGLCCGIVGLLRSTDQTQIRTDRDQHRRAHLHCVSSAAALLFPEKFWIWA